MSVQNIVVGVDGSATGWRALAMATGLASRNQAIVHACFVLHVPAAAEMGAFAIPVPPVEVAPADCSDLAAEVAQELALAGVDGDFVYRQGDVARQLEAVAESYRADMLVIGRSRHPALHMGGTPRRLLAMGRRPVLVVP